MSEYVERVTLEVNGQVIDDFEEVTENEVEIRKPVNLMNKTGFTETTPRYGAKVKYAIPKDSAEFDFAGIKDGTLTIDRGGGKRITYTGVFCTKIGETQYGKDAATKTIEFGAADRKEN